MFVKRRYDIYRQLVVTALELVIDFASKAVVCLGQIVADFGGSDHLLKDDAINLF